MKGNRLFSREQEEFIRRNVVSRSNQELTDLVNEKFKLSITIQQIKTWKNNRNLSSGLTGRFEKGHEPVNKGTKGMFNVGGNSTSFKSGQRPKNYKPIGTERVDRDGYTLIKVRDDGTWPERWRLKHVVIWEKSKGLVPKGHKIIFLNQDKKDIRLENLKCISHNEMLQMNRNGWVSDNPEATKVGVTLAKVKNKMNERIKAND